jgi:hypothetical protein
MNMYHNRAINVKGTTVMWDVTVITDQTILANLPAIVLCNKKEKMCLLTDIAIPDDSNVNPEETETKQFKDLEIKVSRIWKVRTKIVPVVIGALGKIKKGLDQNLQLLPGLLSAIELQKIALMSTAHIIYKVLESITLISC